METVCVPHTSITEIGAATSVFSASEAAATLDSIVRQATPESLSGETPDLLPKCEQFFRIRRRELFYSKPRVDKHSISARERIYEIGSYLRPDGSGKSNRFFPVQDFLNDVRNSKTHGDHSFSCSIVLQKKEKQLTPLGRILIWCIIQCDYYIL